MVDASGRGAPTLTLLDALCWDRPQMTEIGVDITYATAVVSIPSVDSRLEARADAARSARPRAARDLSCRRKTDAGSPQLPTIAQRRE